MTHMACGSKGSSWPLQYLRFGKAVAVSAVSLEAVAPVQGFWATGLIQEYPSTVRV